MYMFAYLSYYSFKTYFNNVYYECDRDENFSQNKSMKQKIKIHFPFFHPLLCYSLEVARVIHFREVFWKMFLNTWTQAEVFTDVHFLSGTQLFI